MSEPPAKRVKEDIRQCFGAAIFDPENIKQLKQTIANAEPYHWGHLSNLFEDSLLRSVRKEVETEIHFTEKETDIYKVFQSGDLANLSGLDWDDLSRLPSLFKLREALYSQQFRDLISEVTQCGKLSGIKTDMSINTYTKGCHLLTHDDVIGSRRVSFILYLPDRHWKEHYGGALRLFPSVVPNVPRCDPSAKFIPQFNEMAFFKVQPGLSFHDVEEVRVDKQRLSIQGWYHIPQSGEDGFVEGEEEDQSAMSTLSLLQSKKLQEYDFPKEVRIPISVTSEDLTSDEVSFLGEYLNPQWLEKAQIMKLQAQFIEENLINIDDLLKDEVASKLKKIIRMHELNEHTPKNMSEVAFPWKMAVPPHKWRYMYMDGTDAENSSAPDFDTLESKDDATKELAKIATFMKSPQYQKWLSLITDLVPTSEQILVRRFRPGQDFTLATSVETTLLESTLCLTPTKNWNEVGGYELCMVMDDDEDPAVYKNGDDSILSNVAVSWNKLTVMVRDESVLKFVKYVGFNSEGGRWDIVGQWDIEE